MKKKTDAFADKLRRGAIRIGLEVIQGLNSKSVAQPSEDQVPENVEEFRNNPYINREGIPLAMDIFKPKGEEFDGKELPVIVAIHGGGLITGDRKISLNLSRELAARGYLVFAIEYRLAPRANVCEQFDDICAGMDYVGRRLLEFEVDYTRIFMTADSAGAFLAVYSAAMKKSKKLQDAIGYEPSRMLFKAIGLSCGMFYTNRDDILGGLLSEQFYGDKKDDSSFLQYMNPEHPEIINNLPPTFLVTSRGDFLNRYTIQFEKALKKAGKTTKMLYYSEQDLAHTFNFAHPDLPQSKDANEKMLAFFEEQAAIQAKRQQKNRETQSKLRSIEKKLQNGSYEKQKLWKMVRITNSVSDERLDVIALKDDARSFSYRQMFRRWDNYAEVFSALKMTGRSRARVGIVGAMTKEAVFAFYALNITGANISLLPYQYADRAAYLKEAIQEEKLTDLILTDYATTPELLKDLMEQKESLGLSNVIVLRSDVCKPGAGEKEIQRAAKNMRRLKKVPGPLFMPELLIRYEATPIVYGKSGGDAAEIILHKQIEGEDNLIPVVFTDEEINAGVLDLAAHAAGGSNFLVGLTSDLHTSYALLNQLQLTLYSGSCLVIPYKTGYHKSFLKAIGSHHINSISLYASELAAMIDQVKDQKLNATSLDQVTLFGEKIPEETIAHFQTFFEKLGLKPSITVFEEKRRDYSEPEALPVKTVKPEASTPAAMPYAPYGYGTGAVPFGIPAMGAASGVIGQKPGGTRRPLVWVDSNGNSHDLLSIFQKLIPAIASNMQEAGAKNAQSKTQDEDDAKNKLMGILAVLFDPCETDYYYED